MSVARRRSALQCSSYIQETLRYLAKHGGYHSELYKFIEKEQKEYNLIQAESDETHKEDLSEQNNSISHYNNEADVTIDADNYEVLSEVGDETIDIDESFIEANTTIRDDDYEVRSEVGEDDEVDITIDEHQYEVLSEVGNETIDISEAEVLPEVINETIDLTESIAVINNGENVPENKEASPKPSLPSGMTSCEKAIDSPLSLGRIGMLQTKIPKSDSPLNPYNRKVQICKFFMKGTCRFGVTGNIGGICKYRHLSPALSGRIGTRYRKRFTTKKRWSKAAVKTTTKQLKRNALHQVKKWLISGISYRK